MSDNTNEMLTEKIKQTIAKRIKSAREDKKLTTQEVANYLGLSSASAITNYESGRRDLSAETLAKLALLFNVSLTWLTGLNDEKDKSIAKLDERELTLLLYFRNTSERNKTIIENVIKSIVRDGEEE